MKTLLALALSLVWGVSAASATTWPEGTKAAVVLTYDDALDSQLDHAVPVLDAAGFKATFFLSGLKVEAVPRWRAVGAEGHELANHTIFHPCPASKFSTDPRNTSEAYTLASMLKEIEQQNVFLTALDGKPTHGFASPCGQTMVGSLDYIEALRAANLVTYVRGVYASSDDLRADVDRMDPMHIPSRGFDEGVTGAQLIDFAKQAQAGGGMAVYLFHGVGGDYLQVSDAAHRELIAWLAAHRSEVWVTTLQGALDWAKAHPNPQK
ncbi:polysaccharide deacetylase family protein [Sphingobium sp. BYY-5]|uniref:polysaccharide deacetylase family protein n=1 Tax=Sphingobium sp. BYY-5 TaxID=2926400 RepID=UPI001FA7BB5B|nr:polysaccharide deacetylase family protein [Sphingobium sp. BYY-5]MCI4592556.1 polysaccharide deacetylase family protein [Sphingobium sp. BYY-5]